MRNFLFFRILFAFLFLLPSVSLADNKKKCSKPFSDPKPSNKQIEKDFISIHDMSKPIQKAFKEADSIRKKAYSPYSHFKVGSSLIISYMKGGKKHYKTFSGFNIENASFSVTICAERTALSRAIVELSSQGIKNFSIEALFIVADRLVFACGVCTQFLSEWAKPDMDVYVGNPSGQVIKKKFKDLVPHAFTHF